MSVSSQTAEGAQDHRLVLTESGQVRAGTERVYPLNKLKRSPDNVRKGGHSDAVIERRAASILAKGLVQLPVVRPERRADGSETGYAFVTAGESRRLALRLLAKRKLIPTSAPVRCLVDEVNDPVEISLDENISREPLHPADEFEAFFDLAENQGRGAEEIAARFGVTAAVVRQRLRLAAVAPDLIGQYREGALTLDQLMAFAVCEDHARQRQVFETYPNAHPSAIRRALTEKTVQADDRRVRFIGLDAYLAAGGVVMRDLFTEDRGGYLTNVALVDQMACDKLAALAEAIRRDEGFKWAQGHLDYPHGHGLSRVWPKPVALAPERLAEREVQSNALAALLETWGAEETLPPDVEAEVAALEAALEADVTEAYAPEDLARAGVWVILGYDGAVRVERGLLRPEDVVVASADPEADGDEGDAHGPDDGAAEDAAGEAEPDDGDPRAPISARLIADLTAHRTAGLRLAVANDPDLALVALTHALVLSTFRGIARASCLEVSCSSAFLPAFDEGVKTNPAYEALETRFGQWAAQLPDEPEAIWDFIVGLDHDSRASLLAFCVGRSLDAVKSFSGRGAALAHADTLATLTDLDMAQYWSPTAERYLGRVTKAHVLAAVEEAVSADTARQLSGLKKTDLVAAVQPLLVEARWLPPLLRTRKPQGGDPQVQADEAAGAAGEADEAQAPSQPWSEADVPAEGEAENLMAAE